MPRDEQLAILELADEVEASLDAKSVPAPDLDPVTGHGPPITRLFPDGYNLGLNCGPAASQTVMHLRLHLIPRDRGDHSSAKGGVRWIFPKKAKYWDE